MLFAGLAVALGLGLVNSAAALYELAPYGVRKIDGQPQGLYVRGAGRMQLRKGAHLKGLQYEITVNSLGFRGEELADPKPADGYRIWAVGGSTTFDIFAPDDASTWPAVAGRALQERWPERTVEVVNAGIPGEILWGSSQDLANHWRAVAPDVVVLYHGINDIRRVTTPPAPPNTLGGPVRLPDIALVRVFQATLGKPRAVPEAWLDRRMTDSQLATVRRELERLLDQSAAARIPVLLATHALHLPDPWSVDDAEETLQELALQLSMGPVGAAEAVDRYNELVRTLVRERGLALVDVRAAVPGEDRYWGDPCHFSAAGSELAGRAVAEALAALGSSGPGRPMERRSGGR